MRGAGTLFAGLLLASCSGATAGGDTGDRSAYADAPRLTGFGDLRFGSSFEDAIQHLGRSRWNAAALKKCLDNLPLAGCFLFEDNDSTSSITKNGIPYILQLSFNKHDRLTDVDLNLARRSQWTQAQCIDLHERTLDWLSAEYGPFVYADSRPQENQRRTSAGGRVYEIHPYSWGGFVTSVSRNQAPDIHDGDARPIARWNDRAYVSEFAAFETVNHAPECLIDVGFKEPESVERRTDRSGS